MPATFNEAFEQLITSVLFAKMELMLKYPKTVGLNVLQTSSLMDTTNFYKRFAIEFQLFVQLDSNLFIIILHNTHRKSHLDYAASLNLYEGDDLRDKLVAEFGQKQLRRAGNMFDNWRNSIIAKIKAQIAGQNIMTE